MGYALRVANGQISTAHMSDRKVPEVLGMTKTFLCFAADATRLSIRLAGSASRASIRALRKRWMRRGGRSEKRWDR